MRTKRGAVILAAFGLVACGGEPSVDWENYSPDVKTRIDQMAKARDCAGLQAEFNVADQNDDAQRARTGDGNADLMSYIDAKLREAGCYD
jgi:hypothetical protein